MNIMSRLIALLGVVMIFQALGAVNIAIQTHPLRPFEMNSNASQLSDSSNGFKIALISSPQVIGKYTQSTYDVVLSTLLGEHTERYTLERVDIPDESAESLSQAVAKIRQEGFNAILAPLTLTGARHLAKIEDTIDIFVPTVHKRDIPDAPENFTFGAIDYVKQIETLLPYMGNSIAIFYDDSAVGIQLKKETESLFAETGRSKKSVSSYSVDANGDNIISHLSKTSAFSHKSIIIHIPVVKSAILAAHMTFKGIKERNILSTQINVDPALLTLTQYNDRQNMILANSIVDHPSAIFEANALMNNDIAFDWINYAASVGADYLVAKATGNPREYSLRIVNAQVIYPVELLKAEMFGFEPIAAN